MRENRLGSSICGADRGILSSFVPAGRKRSRVGRGDGRVEPPVGAFSLPLPSRPPLKAATMFRDDRRIQKPEGVTMVVPRPSCR
jgi:hypothetical protein